MVDAGRGACVDSLLAVLTPAQRAGQLLMVGVPADDPTADVVSVVASGVGGVFLRGRSSQPKTTVTANVSALQHAVAAARGVPLQVSADQEGGQVQTLSGDGMPTIPSALIQGRWDTSQLVTHTQAWASALVQAGVTLDLAPVADVVPPGTASQNPPIGAVDRGYGSTPQVVGAAVQTVVATASQMGLLSTVKHFPGLGRVRVNTDTSTGAVDNTTSPADPALGPFTQAIRAGVAAVMISSASYPGLDARNLAVFSPPIITGLLRNQLGFAGLVLTDDMGTAAAVAAVPPGQRALQFIQAGGDVILTNQPSDVAPMLSTLNGAAAHEDGFRSRIDVSVRRVLTTKIAAGLIHC